LQDTLSVAHRLSRETGYDHVVRAENVSDGIFRVFFVQNSQKNSRLGIIIGKKTVSGAADRNRIKRIIRETFRQHNIKQNNLDVVVLVRRPFPQAASTQAANLIMLFNRIENRCAEF